MRPDPPATQPPVDPCADSPTTTPGCPGYVPPEPVDPCEARPTTTPGCPGYVPPRARYRGWQDNLLYPTWGAVAHEAGYTGAGVKVGVIDSGLAPGLPAFDYDKVHYYQYRDSGTGEWVVVPADPTETSGHGTNVLGVLAGQPTGDFEGGMAPDAEVYVVGTGSGGSLPDVGVALLYDEGVRIFSFSMGAPSGNFGLGLDAEVMRTSSLRAFGRAILEGNSLVIFTAGNRGDRNISVDAVVPYYIPEFAHNWIAATGVRLDDKGNVKGLYRDVMDGSDDPDTQGAAACGIAKDWCVASVWPVLTYGPNGPEAMGGTSMAAPAVAGVAALVSGAFPWMTGENLQTTILTTATHLSADRLNPTAEYDTSVVYAPNEIYGWGIINAWRAVHGPGQFDREFEADVGGYRSEFSNVIRGEGSLTLSGGENGVLELSADNTYTGGTTINSATLLLTGSVASSVTVNGGALRGDGQVNGHVGNTGGNVWSAGDGLTINGNYTAGAGSTTSVAIGVPLAVTGTATLDGTLAIKPNAESYTPQARETLVDAGTRSGEFASTDVSGVPMWNVTVSYAGNDVVADLTRKKMADVLPGAQGAAAGAVVGIDNALDMADAWSRSGAAGHDGFLGNVARFMAAPNEDMAALSIESLSGEMHGSVAALQAVALDRFDHGIALHQSLVPVDGKGGAWVQATGGSTDLAASGFADARNAGSGFMGGFEFATSENLRLGAALGSARSHSTFSGLAGRVEQDDLTLALYGRAEMGGGYYLAGRVTWTQADMDMRRELLLGEMIDTVQTSRNDEAWRVSMEAGKRIGDFTPYIGVTGLRLHQGAFTETGVDGFGLTAQAHSRNATLADLGLRWNTAFEWTGGKSSLTGYLAWSHLLSGSDTGFDAALTGTPEAIFPVNGQPLVKDTGKLGLMLYTEVSPAWGWYVGGEYQDAGSRQRGYSASAGVMVKF